MATTVTFVPNMTVDPDQTVTLYGRVVPNSGTATSCVPTQISKSVSTAPNLAFVQADAFTYRVTAPKLPARTDYTVRLTGTASDGVTGARDLTLTIRAHDTVSAPVTTPPPPPPVDPLTLYPTPHIAATNTPSLYLKLQHLPATAPGAAMGLMSGAGWDPATGEWFQAQEVAGDLLIHRHHADGTYFSTMTLTAGGHGNQIAVERSGTALKIWVMWDTGTSSQVRRIQYNGVVKDISLSELIDFGNSATAYQAPALDQDNDLVCIRMTTGGNDIFKVYRLSEILAGNINQIGVTVNMGPISATTYQGHTISGTSVYRITDITHTSPTEGNHESNSQADWDAGTDVPNNVDEYNWQTGAKLATKDYRRAAQFASDVDQFRLEPEGLDIVNISGKPVLVGIWKTGSGDIGAYNEQHTRIMQLTPAT